MGRIRKALLAAVCLLPTGIHAQPKRKVVSAADCRFSTNPSEFLTRESRIRSEIYDRAAKRNIAGSDRFAVAADSLPRRSFIDEEVFGKLVASNVPSAPLSTDEEFLRRIYLDLTGRIPSADDIRAFLSNTDTDKRDAVIDKLLNSPEYIDRWTMWMGDLLQNTLTLIAASVNRLPQGRNMFYAYLRDAVANDKPLRTLAAEVITGNGNNSESPGGAANFPLGASTAMGPIQDTYDTMLVKSVTTLLGLGHYDCLLCHNGRGHLDQVSLWGVRQTRIQAESMAAFFSRMVFTPSARPANSLMVSDSPSGGYDLNTDSGNRPNRVPVGAVKILTPEYRETGATPADGNWRAAIAESLTQDPMFGKNLANRIWKEMFNLALVEPVDTLDPARLDPANPPDAPWDFQTPHPQLLEKLAADLARQDFHLRSFLRTLARSSAYQLSSRYSGEWKPGYVPLFARHYARRLEGEEIHDAIVKATGLPGAYSVQGMAGTIGWAMQLPEPAEPRADAAALNFLNAFLRGNRDTQFRSQDGSIQQQLYLMNDPFVGQRIKVSRSQRLAAMASIARDEDLLDEVYLSFLSRHPSVDESASGLAFLAKSNTPAARSAAVEDLAWVCVNKVDFLFSY